ncbi:MULTISPECIES: hypothetical protein [Pseudomonas]|uniref:hypothetical protein n=1 Tax=Pseudomonas TaxID=286 RepID=UPI0010712F05|nr:MULTISPECIES: hypothetical protein [Pseudomonas]QBR30773.1 hypothetical protein E3Z29_09570 [Pseudomonas sp. S150]UZT94283.1 hypothetical protein OPS05_06865 [Pseudomonas koreensis]
MWVWQEARERWLLVAVVVVFALLCLVNLRLPLLQFLEGGAIAAFLCADATISVTSDLLVGLISAYVFYVIIELLPSHRKKVETLRVLNLLVASVVDAYDKASIFGHERSLSSLDLIVLKRSKLKSTLDTLDDGAAFLQLKFAMQTGHSRYQDFQHALSLAVGLSPQHALNWLVLTDKIRLLADEYGVQPVNPNADYATQITSNIQDVTAYFAYEKEMDLYMAALLLRVTEFFEAALDWMEYQNFEAGC